MINKEKNFVSAVVYVHNGHNAVKPFLDKLCKTLEENFEHSEIICVNDCSTDDSLNEIKSFCNDGNPVSITALNMSYFHGIELSMNAGVDLSIGDFVFEFDSLDMDYDATEIMEVYRKALEGFDIVSLSPKKRKCLASRLFYSVFNHFAGFQQGLVSETLRILSRRVINRIGSMSLSVPYRKALYANSGLKTSRLFYDPLPGARYSCDKQEGRYKRKLAMDSLRLFTDVGYKFSIYMAMIMMGVAITMLVYSVVVYLTSTPVEGWTTTILFLSFVFFGLFGVLTVIIKYLQILVDLIFKRKRYCFENIEKLT